MADEHDTLAPLTAAMVAELAADAWTADDDTMMQVPVETMRGLLATVDAYREIVDSIAHEDRHRLTGMASSEFMLLLIERARELIPE